MIELLSKISAEELLQIVLCAGGEFLGTRKELVEIIIDQNLVCDEKFLAAVTGLRIGDPVAFWEDTFTKQQGGVVTHINYEMAKVEIMYDLGCEEEPAEVELNAWEFWKI